MSLVVVAAGCGYDSSQASEGAVLEQQQDALSNSCTTTANCNNCVSYASCMQPRLPGGLTTYEQKAAIINRSIPFPGCVAVIKTDDTWGHVAHVDYYNSYNGTVYISEGNWPWGQCGSRSGTASQLKITGYWCP